MAQRALPAVFFRGGTSKAVFFNGEDVPTDDAERDAMLLAILGGNDPYGRQLDGLGGGVSSLSKAMWVSRSTRNDADVDYTFAQIAVDKPLVDYSANCGNMTSCVGPFAVEHGLVSVEDGEVMVRLYNTNTGKVIHAHFEVANGEVVSSGDLEIPGVPGTGAPIKLAWQQPSGMSGRGLFPSGHVLDSIEIPGHPPIEASIVDSAALCVFLRATDLGLTATEQPEHIDAMGHVMNRLDRIRREAGVLAGIAETPDQVPEAAPKIALVARPADYEALDARVWSEDTFDVAIRMESMGKIHKAIPLTGALCVATAAKVPGTLVQSCLAGGIGEGAVRIGTPSGVVTTDADVSQSWGEWTARSASAFRTFRKLMEGAVFY